MKKLFFLFTLPLLLMLAEPLQAQEYRTAIGFRLSPFWGVTAKHFINSTDAIEGILHSRWNALKISVLWERHTQAFNEPGLMFYYGGGGHIGITGNRFYDNRFYSTTRIITGIDGIIGLEYSLQNTAVPLNFSIDWKPTFDFAPFSRFWGSELAVSVRVTFE